MSAALMPVPQAETARHATNAGDPHPSPSGATNTPQKPRKNASRYPAGWRACAWCRRQHRFLSGRRYCSPSCAVYGRTVTLGDAALKAQAIRASRAASAARSADVLARVAGMTALEAYRYGRDLGYTAGWNAATYRARRRRA